MRSALVIAALATISVNPLGAQQDQLSDGALREVATTIAAKYKDGNSVAALKDFDKAVKARFGDVESRPLTVYYSPDAAIVAMGPLYSFRNDLETRIRKMEPIDAVHYEDSVGIWVVPSTINAQDFSKIVVRRDGQIVEPLSSSLEMQEMKTRMGAAFSVHVGAVKYPLSAFAPGAVVTITAIPESGRNIEKKLSDGDLKRLR